MLISLQPIRDRKMRVSAYHLGAYPSDSERGQLSPDDETRYVVDLVGSLTRIATRTLYVPVTPAVVREGSLTRFASTDATWLVSTEALEDTRTRKDVDRLLGAGFRFALDGFPAGAPLPGTMGGCTVVLDALRTAPPLLASRVQLLLQAGFKPMVRNVDDRLTHHRVMRAGAALYSGRLLTRGASTPIDRNVEDSLIRAMSMLVAFADGRPADASFDAFVRDDPHLAASLLKAMNSAAFGVRGPRSVTHAMTMLGRDAIMERLVAVAARLIGEAARDPELAFAALRRARMVERVGAALDNAPHPRARIVAGLLSVLEFALGAPSTAIADRLALPPALREALIERFSGLGQLLDVVDAIEYGWWEDLTERCAQLGIATPVVSDAWLAAWRAARDELDFSNEPFRA